MRITLSCLLVVASLSACSAADLPPARGEYVATGTLASPHAVQAAAADETSVYAVSNTQVVRHDRTTGKEITKSTGPAEHLNSAVVHAGKVYCAHSNYPKRPLRSDIRVFDPATGQLVVFHAFDDPPGSLTWAVPKDGGWWCCFAHYGKDNARTILVRFDAGWKEVGRWTFPKELVADWGGNSLSGGLWVGNDLLATGHDRKVVYRLRLPKEGTIVEVVEAIPSPFPGQGIAVDPKTGGLVGIDRAKKCVVFARFEVR